MLDNATIAMKIAAILTVFSLSLSLARPGALRRYSYSYAMAKSRDGD
jgi:hypothetical protein